MFMQHATCEVPLTWWVEALEEMSGKREINFIRGTWNECDELNELWRDKQVH